MTPLRDVRLRRQILWTFCTVGIGVWLWLVTGSAALAQADDLVRIGSLQGTGAASPVAGQSAATWGQVTGLTADGFFVQDPTGDGDPATSDGVYVYTRSAPAATA